MYYKDFNLLGYKGVEKAAKRGRLGKEVLRRWLDWPEQEAARMPCEGKGGMIAQVP